MPSELGRCMYNYAVLSSRYREMKDENESQRGAMQAALLALEVVVDLLTPPGALVEEAQGLLEDALTVLQEELEE